MAFEIHPAVHTVNTVTASPAFDLFPEIGSEIRVEISSLKAQWLVQVLSACLIWSNQVVPRTSYVLLEKFFPLGVSEGECSMVG